MHSTPSLPVIQRNSPRSRSHFDLGGIKTGFLSLQGAALTKMRFRDAIREMDSMRPLLLALCWLHVFLIGAGCESLSGSDGMSVETAELPAAPLYMRSQFKTPFFVEKRGVYNAIGMLPKNTLVILLNKERSWADIQLESGHVGSVLMDSLKFLTPLEAVEEQEEEWNRGRTKDLRLEPLPRTAGGIDASLIPVM